MAEAKFDKETREFIENLFKEQKYSLEKQISYLEIKERQKYNYYCSRTNNTWNWSQTDDDKFNAEWNEIIEMINERKGITAWKQKSELYTQSHLFLCCRLFG